MNNSNNIKEKLLLLDVSNVLNMYKYFFTKFNNSNNSTIDNYIFLQEALKIDGATTTTPTRTTTTYSGIIKRVNKESFLKVQSIKDDTTTYFLDFESKRATTANEFLNVLYSTIQQQGHQQGFDTTTIKYYLVREEQQQ